MAGEVVITGLGMVTPLGGAPGEILDRIAAGECAAAPHGFTAGYLPCPCCARIPEFNGADVVPEAKTLRLMNRDALLAVCAARRAMEDARVQVGRDYASDDVALFGATGLAGVPLTEVSRLIQDAADEAGNLDLRRFGAEALKRVRPVLSFKILSNMPMCFVSIFEGIQGANAVYNPWEGQGATALIAAIKAIQQGDAACALAGGCDVKTHELGLIALRQLGVMDSWRQRGHGCIPAEGAGFIVLEDQEKAAARGARIYARVRVFRAGTIRSEQARRELYESLMKSVECRCAKAVVSGGDGDVPLRHAEDEAMRTVGIEAAPTIRPKAHVGNVFAAAAALQVGLAAAMAKREGEGAKVLANCFGYGSEQAAFLLEGA